MLTRKHYTDIAAAFNVAIQFSPSSDTTDSLILTAERIADVLKLDNPRFDYSRFMAACNPANKKVQFRCCSTQCPYPATT